MALISAKEFKERNGKAAPTSSAPSGGGLVSAKDFKAQRAQRNEDISRSQADEQFDVGRQFGTPDFSAPTPTPAVPTSPSLPGRNVPVVGPLLKFLDEVAANPISRAIAEYTVPDAPLLKSNGADTTFSDIFNVNKDRGLSDLMTGGNGRTMPGTNAREAFLEREGKKPSTGFPKFVGQAAAPFFVPGAGLGTGAGLTRVADETLTAVPQLQGAARLAVREAAVGAPIGFGSEYAQGDGDFKTAALMGAAGGALGGAVGGAVGALKPAAQFLKDRAQLRGAVDDFVGRTQAVNRADFPASRTEAVYDASRMAQPGNELANRYRYINRNEFADALGLPMSRREQGRMAAAERAVHTPGEAPIAQSLDGYQVALPEGAYIPPRRLQVESSPDSYLNRVMEEVRPIVNERMTPPLENPNELAKWIQTRLGIPDISMNEIRKIPYEGLQQLADDVRAGMSVRDEAMKAARELGYDLGSLLEGKTPNVGQRVAQDSAARVAGVYPDSLPNVRQPEGFNVSARGVADAPVSVPGRNPAAPKPKGAPQPVQSRQQATPIPATASSPKTASGLKPAAEFLAERAAAADVQPMVLNGSGRPTMSARAPKKPRTLPVEQPAAQVPQGDTQAYAGNAMPFRRAITQNERTISRNQIVKNMKKNLGVVIDTGKLNLNIPGVAGVYKQKPEVIRTAMAEDLQVISHEIGHHFDNKFKLQADPVYHNELAAVVQNNPVLNASAYHPSQLPGEGVAEYVRLRLTDPDLARQFAPNFTAHFDNSIGRKMMKGLEATRRDIDTWITQGEYNQAIGLIDFESGSRKAPFSWDKLYTRMLDDLNPLKLAEKALRGAVGVGAESVYKMARLSRGVGERAKMAITRGIFDSQGNKLSDGLMEILKPLEDLGITQKDFAAYLSAKHSEDLIRMGKTVPFDKGQMQSVMSRLDTPEVRAIHQEVMKYNNALLDILVDAQILTSKGVAEMKTKYPNYVPFFRYFDNDAIAGFKNGGFGAAKGFANITNPLKRMSEEGSTRTIINPIESMVKNTFLAMNAASKNKVGLQLAELSKVDGAGSLIEHVGQGGRDPKDHIISVWEKGVQQQYKIREPELYNAMLSLDAESTNSLIKFAGGIASVLRAGATLTPEFIVRNAFRDVVGAMINSTKHGFTPLDFFKGLSHTIGKTDTFNKFINSGGAMGTMMSLDRDASREALQSVFKLSTRDRAMNMVTDKKELAKLVTMYTPVKSIIGVMRKGAEISELATKVGAFDKTLRKTGSLEEAAFTARDLMDFNRAGSNIRQANKAVAFLNAALQGTDKSVRAFKDNPASFMIRAFTTLVLPSVGLYYMNRNLPPEQKKAFDNIPQWQKDSFFIIPIPGTEQFARIPKPFELGMLFATGTERFLRWAEANDPDAFKKYGSTLAETLTPPMLISGLTPMLEAITNHSLYRNAPIVPQGEQRFQKEDQYGLFTSETAKLLGKGVAAIPGLDDSNFASPRIIDNTIKGYTAGLGQYGTAGLDAVINTVRGGKDVHPPERRWYEEKPVNSFLATTSGGGQVRQNFYDEWDKLSKKKASADRNQQPFTEPSYLRLKAAKSLMDGMMEQYKVIQQHKTMSPSDKRSRLDQLDAKMNEIASRAMIKVGGK